MKSFLFVLLTGCAVSPVVVEEESRLLLIGNPDTVQEEASANLEPNATNTVDSFAVKPDTEETEDVGDNASSSVFFPGKLDFDKPTSRFLSYTPSKLDFRGMVLMALQSLATARSVC